MSTAPLPPNYYGPPEPTPPVRRNRQKIVLGVAATVLVVVLGLLITVVMLPRSYSFRQYVLRKALPQITDLAGVPVHLRDFSLHLSGLSPSLDLYDLTVEGAEPYRNPPLLQVDHIGVGIRVVSVARREWYFNDVRIDRPVARVLVDQQGTSNLPQTKNTGQSQTSVFDLNVRHVQLVGGEAYYNDQKSELNADLRDFQFQSGFDPGPKRYSVEMSYHKGNLQISNFKPLSHDLEVQFEATPSQLTLKRAMITSAPSQVEVTATLADYAHPQVRANYGVVLDAGQLRQILNNSSLPTGMIRISGSGEYNGAPDSANPAVRIQGNIASSALQIQMPDGRGEARDVTAQYTVTTANASSNRPLFDSLNLEGNLAGGTVRFQNASGQAEVRDINARYTLTAADAFDSLHLEGNLGGGTVRFQNASGQAEVRDINARYMLTAADLSSNRPLLNLLNLEGNLEGNTIRLQTANGGTEVRDIGVRYTLKKGDAEVRDLRARVLGGDLTGSLLVRDVAGRGDSRLRASLKRAGLAGIQDLINPPSSRPVMVTGTANADAEATWHGSMENLAAKADADVHAAVTPNPTGSSPSGSNTAVPLEAEIHSRYVAAGNEISFTQSSLRTNQTVLTLNGTVSDRSALQVRFQAKDLNELEMIANVFRTPNPGEPLEPIDLYGSASFNGTVQGSVSAPALNGQFTAAALRVKGTEWKSVRTNIDVSPSMVSLRNGEIQPAGRGRLTFDATAGLADWSFTETSPIDANAAASQINLADIAMLAGLGVPVSGNLNANLSVHGSQTNPMGQGTINLTQVEVSGEPIQSLDVNVQGTGDELRATLNMRMPAGTTQGAFTYLPKQQGYEAQLQTAGFRLDQLQAAKSQNLQLAGSLDLRASGKGTFDNPEGQLSLEIPRLEIENQTITGLTLQANVANHAANVALDSQALNTFIRGHAKMDLTGDYNTEAALDTSVIALQPLIATYAPAQAANIKGSTEVHATLRGPLKDTARLEAHVTIPMLAVNYADKIQIGAENPIQIDYAKSVLSVQRTTIKGTDTQLVLQGTVPLNSTAPASLLAQGSVDLRLATLIAPDITSSGQVRFNVDSYGQRTSPDVHGRIEIVGANFATADAPLGLQNGNGVVTVLNDRLEIEQFRGTVGSGTVTLQGGLVYRPSVQYNVALTANGIRMMYPPSVREALDINLTMTGSTEEALLRGQVRLNQLGFTPDFDLANLAGQFSGESSPPPAQSFSRRVKLDIAVQSTNQLNLVSSKLSLQAAADLQVRGTAAVPVVLGRVNVNGGDMIFLGNRYVLQPSTLDFINPTKIEPVMNLAVDTTIQQYDLHIRLRGTPDNLRTDYTSDPVLPQADIINLLVFGKTKTADAANPVPGNLAAQSAVASAVSSQVTGRLEKVTGISQLSIDPLLGGNGTQQNPGARITIQQRVTSGLFVTFSTDTTSTQNQVIKLEYRASPKTSFSGVRDQNGGFAFDVRRRKTW